MNSITTIAAAQKYGTVQYLNGKLWAPVRRFEAHLEQELTLKYHGHSEYLYGIRYSSQSELEHTKQGMLFYCEGIQQDIADIVWKQLCWEAPFIVRFRSIGEAAALLRNIQRNWAHYPLNCFRRAALISAKLPYISTKERTFPYQVPLADMGVWSLLDEHTLIASAKTSSPFPLGIIRFVEDHHNPPSRAYLKLWEALTLADFYARCAHESGAETGITSRADAVDAHHDAQYRAAAPKAEQECPQLIQIGTRCIDAGACPGGWTWVLHQLGATVTAIDRSPLAETLMREPRITFMQHDAFTIPPESLGKQDWVCSDVICYPPRLLEWVERWLVSGLCTQFICTIKMQGAPDFETITRFARIPHSKIVHLTANKHELTWLCAPFIGREGAAP